MANTGKSNQERLEELAREIESEHRERQQDEGDAELLRNNAFRHAARAGELLREARGLVEGEWLKWLEANFDWSQRTAYNYEELARNQDDPDLQRVANESGVRAAFEYLRSKRGTLGSRSQQSPSPDAAEGAGQSWTSTDEEEPTGSGSTRRGPPYKPDGPPYKPDLGRASTDEGSSELLEEKEPVTPGKEEDATDSESDLDAGDETEQGRSRKSSKIVADWKPAPISDEELNSPAFRYMGGKWKLARYIIALFPAEYRTYVEPYLGSAAVLLRKSRSRVEVLNDVDSEVHNLFEVLRTQTSDLIYEVELSLYSEEGLKKAYAPGDEGFEGFDQVSDLERARRFLVRSSQAFLRSGTPSFSLSATSNKDSVRIWNEMPERIGPIARRIKDAYINNRDAVDVISGPTARSNTLVYCDPPYYPGTRADRIYPHEMSAEDHVKMLDALEKHPGYVILSGYDNPLYRDRLGDWERVRLTADKDTDEDREILWLNPKASATKFKKREEVSATPPPGVGMVYQTPPELEPELELALEAEFLEALLEGWRSRQ